MKWFVALVLSVALTGCQTPVGPTKIVTVDKPIPYVPPPPEVPLFVSQVDKLTAADISDPGKIGQAYKYDMVQLRQLIRIYESILQQYKKSSADFSAIQGEIDRIYQDINTKVNQKPGDEKSAPLTSPSK